MKQNPSYKLYLRDGAREAVNKLKDHSINVQAFLRKALKDKAKDIEYNIEEAMKRGIPREEAEEIMGKK